MSFPLVNLNFLIMFTISRELQRMIMILISEWLISCIILMLFMILLVRKHLIVSLGVGISSIIKMFLWLTFMVALGIIFAETTSLTKSNSIGYGADGKSPLPIIFFILYFQLGFIVGFESHEILTQLLKVKKMISEERKVKLIAENEWLPKAIEMLNMRLIDRGFNVLDQWLGYYDEYVLHYVPQTYINNRGEKEVLNWGKLEIHCKEKVFNPYKYCGGDGYEFEKLTEMEMKEKHWKIIKQYIRLDGYQVCGKKVCFDNPYPNPRVEFIDGSDVPINGYYE